MAERRHYLVLDAARGFAAVSMMVHHLEDRLPGAGLIQGSFLAVDLFFLMSGFVVSLSYEGRILRGEMSLPRFVYVRSVRLYPLYFLACLLGLAYFVMKMIAGIPGAPTSGDILLAAPPALLILPAMDTTSWGFGPYPFAPSAWSLCLEFWFSVVYATVVPRLDSRRLAALALVAFAILAERAWAWGTLDLGWGTDNLVGGIGRFWLSFTLGVLLQRNIDRIPRIPLPSALVVALSLCFVLVPKDMPFLQILWVSLVFPAFVVTAARLRVDGIWADISDYLGRISYGLYILHAPLILLFVGAAKSVGLADAPAFQSVSGVMIALLALGVATLATYRYDEPVRSLLRRRRAHTSA